MFGRFPPRSPVARPAVGELEVVGAAVGAAAGESGSPEVAARAAMAPPAPASTPPATSPPFRKVRRLTLLSCSGSMLSMRALILGSALALASGVDPAIALAASAVPQQVAP